MLLNRTALTGVSLIIIMHLIFVCQPHVSQGRIHGDPKIPVTHVPGCTYADRFPMRFWLDLGKRNEWGLFPHGYTPIYTLASSSQILIRLSFDQRSLLEQEFN